MISIINKILRIKAVIVAEDNVVNEHFHDFLYNLILCFLSIFTCLDIDFLQSNYQCF